MPATEPTNDPSKSASGAQQAQGDEVPPELKEGSDGKMPTSGKDVVCQFLCLTMRDQVLLCLNKC